MPPMRCMTVYSGTVFTIGGIIMPSIKTVYTERFSLLGKREIAYAALALTKSRINREPPVMVREFIMADPRCETSHASL